MMKKSNLIILFTFALSTFSFAQDFSKWQIGILSEFGFEINDYNPEYDNTTQISRIFTFENKEKVKFGVTRNYQLKYLFLETGLSYEKRVNRLYEKEHYNIPLDTFISGSNYHYMTTKSLNLPFNIGFRIPTRIGNPYVQAGLYYNRMINGQYQFQPKIDDNLQDISLSAFNQNIVGYQFYAGYQIPILNKFIIDFGVHYSQDFNYFTNDTFQNKDFKYRSLDSTLRLKYNL